MSTFTLYVIDDKGTKHRVMTDSGFVKIMVAARSLDRAGCNFKLVNNLPVNDWAETH